MNEIDLPQVTMSNPEVKWLLAECRKYAPDYDALICSAAPVELALVERLELEALASYATVNHRTQMSRAKAKRDCLIRMTRNTPWRQSKAQQYVHAYLTAHGRGFDVRRAMVTSQLSLRRRLLLEALRSYYRSIERVVTAKASTSAKVEKATKVIAELFGRVELIADLWKGIVDDAPKGHCGCCGKEMYDPVSLARGIGPECRGKEGRLLRWLERMGFVMRREAIQWPRAWDASEGWATSLPGVPSHEVQASARRLGKQVSS